MASTASIVRVIGTITEKLTAGKDVVRHDDTEDGYDG
jgi:hypothetical protein